MIVTNRYEIGNAGGGAEKVNFLCDTLKGRQPKESEKGFIGMISKGKLILMLRFS